MSWLSDTITHLQGKQTVEERIQARLLGLNPREMGYCYKCGGRAQVIVREFLGDGRVRCTALHQAHHDIWNGVVYVGPRRKRRGDDFCVWYEQA